MKRLTFGDSFPFLKKAGINLQECSFESFGGTKSQWCQLVEAQDPEDFSRDPYLQLEKYYRGIGDEIEADKVYYKGRCDLRKHAKDKNSPQIQWSWQKSMIDLSLKWLVGYGVKVQVLLIPFILFIGVGTWLFWPDEALVEVKSLEASIRTIFGQQEKSDPTRGEKLFNRLGYTLDLFIPLVNLGIAKKWEVNRKYPNRLCLEAYSIVAVLYGWILIPLLIASLSGIVKKQSVLFA